MPAVGCGHTKFRWQAICCELCIYWLLGGFWIIFFRHFILWIGANLTSCSTTRLRRLDNVRVASAARVQGVKSTRMKRIIWIFVVLGLIGCAPEADNIDGYVGLHLLSNYGEEYKFLTKTPTPTEISSTLDELDWVNGFHQIVLVTEEGVSMEVGGSLSPSNGLSSVYRNAHKDEHRVTREPPETILEMEEILLSFHARDGVWEKMFVYE